VVSARIDGQTEVGPHRQAVAPGGASEALRFVALGDSLTVGMGDAVPGGGWRGWAALLAPALAGDPAGVLLLNCAVSGALTADVAGNQLERALSHRPHLASVLVGANDTLRGSFDIGAVAERLDTVIGALSAQDAYVLTACLPDPGRMLGLPSLLAQPLGRRMRALNHVVHVLSSHHGAVHLHAARQPWVADRSAWSADRLHPSELGHRLLARDFHALLSAAGLAVGEPPSAEPGGPGPGRGASAWWMATRGTKWIADRCADLLPDLLKLAAAEWRHRAAGSSTDLDLQAHQAAETAIASLRLYARTGTKRTGVPGTAWAAAARQPSGTTPMTG
jgi:lysophospholipase L1-like esterase